MKKIDLVGRNLLIACLLLPFAVGCNSTGNLFSSSNPSNSSEIATRSMNVSTTPTKMPDVYANAAVNYEADQVSKSPASNFATWRSPSFSRRGPACSSG